MSRVGRACVPYAVAEALAVPVSPREVQIDTYDPRLYVHKFEFLARIMNERLVPDDNACARLREAGALSGRHRAASRLAVHAHVIRRVGCFRAAATLYVGIRIASPRLEPLLSARHHEQLQQATADNAHLDYSCTRNTSSYNNLYSPGLKP